MGVRRAIAGLPCDGGGVRGVGVRRAIAGLPCDGGGVRGGGEKCDRGLTLRWCVGGGEVAGNGKYDAGRK